MLWRDPSIQKNLSESPLHWNLIAEEIDCSSPAELNICSWHCSWSCEMLWGLSQTSSYFPLHLPASIQHLQAHPLPLKDQHPLLLCAGAVLAQMMPLPLFLANEKRTQAGWRGKQCIQLWPAVPTKGSRRFQQRVLGGSNRERQWGWSHRAHDTLNLELKQLVSHSLTNRNFVLAKNISHHIKLMLLI